MPNWRPGGAGKVIDYHLHTPLCRHAAGSPEEYLAEARCKGLSEIGFADHFPIELLGLTPKNRSTMMPSELPGYLRQIRELAAVGGISVKLGIEVDYLPGTAGKLAKLLDELSLDYVIGSIHFMDGWDFTHPAYIKGFESADLDEVYRRYFELVCEACQSGLFDIVGHVDVIKKFGYRPEGRLESYWSRTARVLKESGTCLELNTAGRDAPVGEFYPARPFLEICRQEGVSVTLGSDAHSPEQVGRYFDEGLKLLQSAGYREIAVFTGRQQSACLLRGE